VSFVTPSPQGRVRRVVTGHDATGKAIVVSDGLAPAVHTNPLRPGHWSVDIWRTDATPARIAETTKVLAQDAYGRGPVARAITTVSGHVRHGNSGGPAIDGSGSVEATIFAARIGTDSGYGTPSDIIRSDLGQAAASVSTGDCSG